MTWLRVRRLLGGLPCLALSGACVSFERPYEVEDSAVEEGVRPPDDEDTEGPSPEATGGTSSVPPEDDEADPPGDEETPPEEGVPECPEYCLGGCIGRTCLIQCIEPDCKNESFECAPEMNCDLVCVGDRACQGVELHCREGSSCSVTCVDDESCKGLELFCEDDAALTCDARSSCGEAEGCLASSDEEMDDD